MIAGQELAGLTPNPDQKRDKSLTVFLLVSFGMGWLLQAVASLFALRGNQMAFSGILSVCMFAPMLGVLAACGGLKQAKSGIRGWRPRFKGHWGSWLIAWLAPSVLTILGAGLYFVLFPERFDPTFSEYMIASAGREAYEAAAAQLTGAGVVAATVASGIAAAPFNMLFAVGEEAGWRGFLHPKLKARFGGFLGTVLSGVVWGAWHWPVMALAGYEYGWSVFNTPLPLVLLGMGLFCVITVGLAVLEDWCYARTGSIWAAGLFHGGFNAMAGAGLLLQKAEYMDQMALGPTPVGVVAALPLLLWAAVLLFGLYKTDAEA